jgi:hypothetical protein
MSRPFESERLSDEEAIAAPHCGSPTQAAPTRDDDRDRPRRCLEPLLHAKPRWRHRWPRSLLCAMFLVKNCEYLNRSGWLPHLLKGRWPFTMRIGQLFCTFVLCIVSVTALGQRIVAPEPQQGSISGTVTDVEDAAIPGATITVVGSASSESRIFTTNETGWFEVKNLDPAVSYTITINSNGFADWTSAVVLKPGQALEITHIRLKISVGETTVVALTVEQLAQQQVKAEEKQRVLGIFPNFYVVYDKNAVPLTTKLKYGLAFRAATDVVSIAGDVVLAGVNQAADTPDYQQGAKGYGQRFGAAYADSFSNVMIGGAVLPSLLHQDPRYFYQGTGTPKSRMMHALANPFFCKGDNGRTQFNYSGIGGNLIAASLANLYYPPSNRGAGLVFSTTLINTGGRLANAVVQEFILRKYTSNSNK